VDSLLAYIPTPLAVVSESLAVACVNPAFRRLTAPTPVSASPDPALWIANAPGLAVVLLGAMARVDEPGRTCSMPWTMGDPPDLVSFVVHVTRVKDGQYTIVFDRVSDHANSVDPQQHSREYLQLLIDHLHVGVLGFDAGLRITFFNSFQASLFRMLGVAESLVEVIGSPAAMSYPVLDRGEWACAWGQVSAGRAPAGPLRVACNTLSGTRHLLVDIVSIPGRTGIVGGGMCVTTDLTRTEPVDHELRRRDRIAATGQFGASLSQQMQTPVDAILDATGALRRGTGLPPGAADQLASIDTAVAHMRAIARRLTELGRSAGTDNDPAPRT
jgi:PAS domain-containing protein